VRSSTGRKRRPTPQRQKPSRRPSNVKRAILVVLLIIVVIVILTPFLREALINWLNPLSYRTFPESVDFTVRRSIIISSVTSHTVDVPEPPDIAGGTQRIVSISSAPPHSTVQKYGDDWMMWQASGSANIQATYHIQSETVWWDIDEYDVLTVSDASKTDPLFNQLSSQHNHDEWRIEYEGTSVETLAAQIAPGNLSVFEIVQKTYEYLDSQISYSASRTGGVKYPLETLQDQTGDCDDMSFLFAALLRSRGVPSWVELGAMLNSVTNEWVGHAWLEFYMPTTTGGVTATVDMANHEFMVRGANRFTEWESDGNGSHLQDYYYPYTYISAPGGTPSIEDTFTTVDYSADGTVVIKLGSEGGAIPGFDILLLPAAILIALFSIRQTRRK
jgi:transglutaminase-like putative cysteine protease